MAGGGEIGGFIPKLPKYQPFSDIIDKVTHGRAVQTHDLKFNVNIKPLPHCTPCLV